MRKYIHSYNISMFYIIIIILYYKTSIELHICFSPDRASCYLLECQMDIAIPMVNLKFIHK